MLAAAAGHDTAAQAAAAAAAEGLPAQSDVNVHLRTRDGSSFTVPLALLGDSATVQAWYAEEKAGRAARAAEVKPKGVPVSAAADDAPTFDVPHVTPYILKKALQFQSDYAESADYDEKAFKFEDVPAEYRELSNDDLLQLTMAANILQMSKLTRVCAELMAETMKDKSAEEIKAMFNVEDLQEIDDEKAGQEELEDAKKQLEEDAATDNATAA